MEMRRKKGWMDLRVDRIVDETHDTKTLYLTDAEEGGRAFDYEAGQYLTFRFDGIEPKPLVRSYTLSSSPGQQDWVAFTVKRVDHGVISNWLCDHVSVGTILRARGPIGRFTYAPVRCQDDILMVAAGSGVTPFVSMLREYAPRLGQTGCPKRMSLLVAYRSAQDLILIDDLRAAAQHPGIDVWITLTRDNSPGFLHGRPDPTLLDHLVGDRYKNSTIFTCGPEPMMEWVVTHSKARGAAEGHVLTESFY